MPEDKVNMREVSQKDAEGKEVESMPDVCEGPASSSEPVDVPYPNTSKSSDSVSGSKTFKIEKKKVMTKKSSFEKSTGDEPGQSTWKKIKTLKKIATDTKILKIPLWIWSFGLIVVIFAIWIIVSNNPQPTEPIEQYIIQLLTLMK
jgi:hypothetical protein